MTVSKPYFKASDKIDIDLKNAAFYYNVCAMDQNKYCDAFMFPTLSLAVLFCKYARKNNRVATMDAAMRCVLVTKKTKGEK